MAEQKKVICPLCGRPVPPRKGTRGSNRTGHTNCNIILGRLAELKARLKEVRWQDDSRIKKYKGDIFSINNELFNVKSEIKYAPDCDEEFEYVIPENKKRNKKKKKKNDIPSIPS